VVYVINTAGVISTFAGNGDLGSSGDGGPATAASLGGVTGLTFDSSGNLYIATNQGNIRVVSPNGIISTYFNGISGFGNGMIFDASGNLYVTEASQVLKITSAGSSSIVVGNGTVGASGDGGPATQAELDSVYYIALDTNGNLLLSDMEVGRIRKVSLSTGIISTSAGVGNPPGAPNYNGDGIPAINAYLDGPCGLAVDSSGNIYIADVENSRVRKVIE